MGPSTKLNLCLWALLLTQQNLPWTLAGLCLHGLSPGRLGAQPPGCFLNLQVPSCHVDACVQSWRSRTCSLPSARLKTMTVFTPGNWVQLLLPNLFGQTLRLGRNPRTQVQGFFWPQEAGGRVQVLPLPGSSLFQQHPEQIFINMFCFPSQLIAPSLSNPHRSVLAHMPQLPKAKVCQGALGSEGQQHPEPSRTRVQWQPARGSGKPSLSMVSTLSLLLPHQLMTLQIPLWLWPSLSLSLL